MNSELTRNNTIPLIGGGQAFFRIPVSLSAANYRHIGKWLDLMEPALTEASATERDAIFQRAKLNGETINHLARRVVGRQGPVEVGENWK